MLHEYKFVDSLSICMEMLCKIVDYLAVNNPIKQQNYCFTANTEMLSGKFQMHSSNIQAIRMIFSITEHVWAHYYRESMSRLPLIANFSAVFDLN